METDDNLLSLATIGLFLNNTIQNQGNHCIVAVNLTRPPVDQGNQALSISDEQCQEVTKNLSSSLGLMGMLAFRQMALARQFIGG
jgi:hypothetical protein